MKSTEAVMGELNRGFITKENSRRLAKECERRREFGFKAELFYRSFSDRD